MNNRGNVSGKLQTLMSAYTLYFLSQGMHSDMARCNTNVEIITRYFCNLPLTTPAFGYVKVRT